MNKPTTVYFDNDVQCPPGLTSAEQNFWDRVMVGRAAVHVPPETWIRLRQEAERDIKWRRERGVR